MPTYKNTSDHDLNFINVGLIKPGEAKTVPDPIEHPSLELVEDHESTEALRATEAAEQAAASDEQRAAEEAAQAPGAPEQPSAAVSFPDQPQPAAAPLPAPGPQQIQVQSPENVSQNQGA